MSRYDSNFVGGRQRSAWGYSLLLTVLIVVIIIIIIIVIILVTVTEWRGELRRSLPGYAYIRSGGEGAVSLSGGRAVGIRRCELDLAEGADAWSPADLEVLRRRLAPRGGRLLLKLNISRGFYPLLS